MRIVTTKKLNKNHKDSGCEEQMSHLEGLVQYQVYFLQIPAVGICLVTGRHYRNPGA
jgi:hypothetical protein